MAKNIISVLFFVDPETDQVDAVFSFSPFGMVVRQDSDWIGIRRENSTLDLKTGHKIYLLDWAKVALTDDLDDPDSEPEPVILYDNGALTLGVLEAYSDLVYNGSEVSAGEDFQQVLGGIIKPR